MKNESKQQSDIAQLSAVLALFDDEVIKRATDSYMSSNVQPAYLSIDQCDDPGKEIEENSEDFYTLEDLSANERLILPNTNFLPAHFLEEGAKLINAVARVHTGRSLGTGFMISRSLFMTNNHVIPDQRTASRTRIQLNFQLDYDGGLDQIDEYRIDPSVFFTDRALDFTVVRLKSKRQPIILNPTTFGEDYDEDDAYDENNVRLAATQLQNPRFPFIRPVHAGDKWGHIPLNPHPRYARSQRFNVIQHPRGRRKEVVLQDNELHRVYTNMVHYTADTEPGSSGSPVFNNSWELVALHHAGGNRDSRGRWISNEGVRLDKIVAKLRQHYSGNVSGRRILRELNI